MKHFLGTIRRVAEDAICINWWRLISLEGAEMRVELVAGLKFDPVSATAHVTSGLKRFEVLVVLDLPSMFGLVCSLSPRASVAKSGWLLGSSLI